MPLGPAWCAAPRPIRSLSVLRSAFPTPWCLSPSQGPSPPDILAGCAGQAEAGRKPGPLCLPLAPAEAGVLGSLHVVPLWGPALGLSLAGLSGVGLGLLALRCLACVHPVTDASGFLYCPSFDGGLGWCTGAVMCGRRQLPLRVGGRHARVLCGPSSRARCGAPQRFLWPLWPSALLGPLLAGVAFFLVLCLPAPCFPFPPPPPPLIFARPLCLLPSLVSGPGCLGPWRFVFPSSPPRPVVLFFFLFVRPLCLWLSLVSGPGCPGPPRCVLFVSAAFCRFWALRALSPRLWFPPGRSLLPGGCSPPPPFVCRGFHRCLSLSSFFFYPFIAHPRCFWLSLVSGPGCPGSWRCVLFVLWASRFSVPRALSPRFCVLLRRWLLPGGCCPPPHPLSSPLVFFSLFRCAPPMSLPPLSLAFSGFWPRVPWALALCVVCSVGLRLVGSLRALASFVFPAWTLAAPWWLPPPPPPPLCLAVFVAASWCSVVFSFAPLLSRFFNVSGPGCPRP